MPAAQPGLFAEGVEPSRAAFKAAQARLLQDKTLQFHLKVEGQTPTPKTPEWLIWLGKVLAQLGHLLSGVFWAAVALGLAAIILFIAIEIARTRWPNLLRRKRQPRPSPVDWRPEAAVARALLAEADQLAAEGHYAEAARLLLHRSIEDIESRRPRLVRPAFTAREIARLEDLPAAARQTFGFIAEMVERSFFGGRDVDADSFAACRRAYEDFAFPGAWA